MNKSQSASCFVLQEIDPATGSAVAEMRVYISDMPRLQEILGIAEDSGREANLSASYALDPGDLQRLGEICEPPLDLDNRFNRIEPWHATREAPYLVHTNFEMPLMLEGRKPLAVFCDFWPASWLANVMNRFGPFVRSGQFVQRVVDTPLPEDEPFPVPSVECFRRVFYSLSGEEWRIDAYLLMAKVAGRTGWNETLERLEGCLLGYEDWQNDWWIRYQKERFSA